jgi:sialidase-1
MIAMQNKRRFSPSWPASLLLFLFCLVCRPARAEAGELFESTNLWNAGIGGYQTYRIPGIVVSKRGVLIAYTSARRTLDLGDWSNINIVLRRSIDGGRSWEASRRIAGDSHGTTDNPVAIVDRQTGALHFLFQKNYARCYYMRSNDDGRTFSPPVDITYVFDQFHSEYDWHVIAPGVGHAIQLRSGRLLVPVWMAIGAPEGSVARAHRPSAVATIYSDDHGKTWKRGDIILNDSPETPNPSESMAVQLADGSVMMNIRNESTLHRRLVSISPDGISHWSKPRFDDQLFEPVCAASIVRYSIRPPDAHTRILFSNPDSEGIAGVGAHQFHARQVLTVRLSLDEGQTWPVKKVVDPGVTGYSDLAVGPDKTIDCIYESGANRGHETDNTHITVARFNLAWLMSQAPPA